VRTAVRPRPDMIDTAHTSSMACRYRVLLVVTICVWPSPFSFANVQFSLFVASFSIFESTLSVLVVDFFLVMFVYSFYDVIVTWT
jgi:hypothetical protein